MPDTGAPWNIPYPLSTDPPDDPSQSKTRAEKIAAQLTSLQSQITALTTRMTAAETKNTSQDSSITAINARTADSGNVALSVSYASGWKAGSYTAVTRKFGGFIWARFSVIRTGAALTASTTGSLGDTNVCTITSAYQPIYNGINVMAVNPGHGEAFGKIDADGVCTITCMLPNSVVATNDELRFTGVWVA